jgi:hypothetical protein
MSASSEKSSATNGVLAGIAPRALAQESGTTDSQLKRGTGGGAFQAAPQAKAYGVTAETSAQASPVRMDALASKSVSARGLSAVPGAVKSQTAIAHWAVSATGQLVRNAPDGILTNIQPAAGMLFRAVAAEGIEVWAGGVEANSSDARGVLFHSSDAGETWTRTEGPWKRVVSQLTLASPGMVTVTADDGKWKSSDGGQSWTAIQ